ncbi:hypothetical protein [Comamonas jiangduensis]|uniref:hypothetical protein n=1 Tax=Comamonas jiangduensis TaxID=1194168 RepID=UPI003BF8EFF4
MEARRSTTEFDHAGILFDYLSRLNVSQFKKITSVMLDEVKLNATHNGSVSLHGIGPAYSGIREVFDEMPRTVKQVLERRVHATVAAARGNESNLTRENIETMVMSEYYSLVGRELLVSSVGGVAGPNYESFNVELQAPLRVQVLDTDQSSLMFWVGDFCRPLIEVKLLGCSEQLPKDIRQFWILGTARSLKGDVLPAHIICQVENSIVAGTQGIHDWCVGHQTEDGFPVYVDDRQLGYRLTFNEARAFAFAVIDRIEADGHYRLGDKPLGFMPPEHVKKTVSQD